MGTLIYYLAMHEPRKLVVVALIYAATAVLEVLTTKRARRKAAKAFGA